MTQTDQFLTSAQTLRGDLRDLMLNAGRNMPKTWAQMNEGEQKATAEYLDALAAEIITRVAVLVASNGQPVAVAKLEKVTVTDSCKASLSLSPQQAAALIPFSGHLVTVIGLNVAGLMGQRGPAQVMPDEPALPGMGEATSGAGGGTHVHSGKTVEITVGEGGAGDASATAPAPKPAPRAKTPPAPNPPAKKKGSPFANG